MGAREPQPYRLEVRLTRDLNHRLELLKKEVKATIGKDFSKSALVVQILSQFFERDVPVSEDPCIKTKTG